MKKTNVEGLSARLVEYAEERLERLENNLEDAIASGDVGAVHDLRVASRRLHEPLGLLTNLAGRGTVRRAQRRLKRVRGAFQKIRDLDVLLISLCEGGALPKLEANDLAQLEGTLTKRRERALTKARKQYGGSRGERAIRGAEKMFEDCVHTPDEAELTDRMTEMFEERTAEVFEKDPRSDASDDLHEARIAVKRFRYCVELSQRLGVRDDDGLVRELTEVQDLLGHWNDQVMAARCIARIAGRRGHLARQTSGSVRLLEYAAQRARAAESERQMILDRWPSLLARIETATGHRRERKQVGGSNGPSESAEGTKPVGSSI